MRYLIEFNDVFEADEGIKVLNKVRDSENQIERSNYGKLRFEIDAVERSLLLQNNIKLETIREYDI